MYNLLMLFLRSTYFDSEKKGEKKRHGGIEVLFRSSLKKKRVMFGHQQHFFPMRLFDISGDVWTSEARSLHFPFVLTGEKII